MCSHDCFANVVAFCCTTCFTNVLSCVARLFTRMLSYQPHAPFAWGLFACRVHDSCLRLLSCFVTQFVHDCCRVSLAQFVCDCCRFVARLISRMLSRFVARFVLRMLVWCEHDLFRNVVVSCCVPCRCVVFTMWPWNFPRFGAWHRALFVEHMWWFLHERPFSQKTPFVLLSRRERFYDFPVAHFA